MSCAGAVWAAKMAAALWAAGPPTASQHAPLAPLSTTAPHHGADELWLSLGAEPSTLDPALCHESVGGELLDNLFAGLTQLRVDPNGSVQVVGDLAERWQTSADGLHYRFFLRPSGWSDGVPLSAHDVVFALRRVLDPRTAAPNAGLLTPIAQAEAVLRGDKPVEALGVSAPDARTVVIDLAHPAPWLLQLLAREVARPVPPHAVRRDPTKWARPGPQMVVSGAFAPQRWRFRRDALLTRQPHYWRAASVPLRRVRIAFVGNADTAMALYEYGDLDLLTQQVPVAWLARARQSSDFVDGPSLTTDYYWLNTTRPPLNDKRVRQALALAIDRPQLCAQVLRGAAEPADGLLPSGLAMPRRAPLTFDPVRARALLAEAGFPDGAHMRPLRLSFNALEEHRHVAEAVAAMWRTHLGVSVTLVQQEWQVYLQELEQRQFDIARLGWQADYADARSFLMDLFGPHSSNNLSGYTSAALHRRLAQSDTSVDAALRARLLQQAEEQILQDMPLIPLRFGRERAMVKPYVRGFSPNPMAQHPWQWLSVATAANNNE